MTAYNYSAVDDTGKRKKGVMQADSAKSVRRRLREQGLTPLTIERANLPQPRQWRRARIKTQELTLLTRQLSTLITAGIPLDEGLAAIAEQTQKAKIKRVILGVRSRVMEGHSLASALGMFPHVFPKLYCTTVAAGERSGKLDQIFSQLADYTEKQQGMRQKIWQALLYPSLMTIVSISVVVFLLIYVVPKIVRVFSQTNQVLPLATVILISISHFFAQFWWLLLLITVIIAVLAWWLLKKQAIRYQWHRFVLKLPLFGKAWRLINSARFGRTLGILTAAGVPILDSLMAAQQLITPLPMHQAVGKAVERVREGVPVHRALAQTHFFEPMFLHLVASGEVSGQLPQLLAQAAANEDRNISAWIDAALTLFEPLLIIVMGGVVLFIVLAIMLPIFALDQLPGTIT